MTSDDAIEFCDTLLRHFASSLTEWEDTFVRDLQAQLARGRPLSSKQADVLDRLMTSKARGYGR